MNDVARGRAALGALPAALLLGVLVGGAIVGAVTTSVTTLDGRASGAAWNTVTGDRSFWDSLRLSATTAALATLISAALAIPIALRLRRMRLVSRVLTSLPVAVPHLLVAAVFVLLLGAGGLVERAVGSAVPTPELTRSAWGIVTVYVIKETPFLVLLLLPALTRHYDAAAELLAVHGANAWQQLRHAVWPLIRRPLLVGGLIAFAYALGALEVPALVGPSYPLSVAEYAATATRSNPIDGQSQAAAAMLLSALLAVAAGVAAALVVARGRDA